MEFVPLIAGIVAAAMVVFAVVLLARAARLRPTVPGNSLPPAEVFGNDVSVERFRALLQSKTVWDAENPEADHSAFDAFIPKLQELYPRVFDTLELTRINEYGMLLYWQGKNPEANPVVLLAHHDVVGANSEEWQYDPFAAEIWNETIYARGAVDTKCILAGLLEAADYLIAQGYTPPHSIYICSSNCEEDMGPTGRLMANYFSERGITPRFVLDEGGAVINKAPLGIASEFAMVGVAEKGLLNVRCTVSSEGGHAATPARTDAPAKLVGALKNLLTSPAPAELSRPVEAMLRELAAHTGLALKLVLANLWLFRPLVLALMKRNPETAAMVRTTYALTELEGSKAINVLPKTATASINSRISPSETTLEASERLKSYFAKAGIAPEHLHLDTRYQSDPSPVSPFDGEVYTYLQNVIHSVYPTAGIAPYLQSSASDAQHFARICPHTYRFAGFLFTEEQRASIHGRNEHLGVESFKRGVGFYVQLLLYLEQLDPR